MSIAKHASRTEYFRERSLAPREFVITPPEAAARLRAVSGTARGERFRIAYIPGPGDVYGTYLHWRNDRLDPRAQIVAYSTMFYEFCTQVEADGQILTASIVADADQGPFTFDKVDWRPWRADVSTRMRRFNYALQCVRRIGVRKPHAVIVASDMDYAYLPLLRHAGAPLILSMHNTLWPARRRPRSFKSRLKRFLLKASASTLRAAICTSAECERQLMELLPRRAPPTFVHAPQPIARRTQPFGDAARRLVYAGRIEGEKGVFDLLDAFEKLALSHASLELKFCGEGGSLTDLQRRIEASHFRSRISTTGHLGGPDFAREIGASDILVCPTRSAFNEGMAMVCIEAAALGVPSVVSSVVPAAEVLPVSSTVFDADSVGSLIAALDGLVRAPEVLSLKRHAALLEVAKVTEPARSWGSLLYPACLAACSASG